MNNSRRVPSALLMVAAIALLVTGCQPAPTPEAEAPAAPDHAAKLKPAVDTFRDVWNTKEYDRLDGVMTLAIQRVAPDANADGLDAMKEFMRGAHTAYPDFKITFDEEYYDEDTAIVVWTGTGTNTGEGATPPTGNRVDLTGTSILKFEGGMIAEERVFYDRQTLMEQLGVTALPHVTD